MESIEQRISGLLERLSAENRQLLALLRLGYSFPRAEALLVAQGKHQKPPVDARTVFAP